MRGDEVDEELERFGVTECRADPSEQYYEDCAVCDHEVKVSREHVHYKGEAYHTFCFVLALLRQLAAPSREA